MSAAIERCHCGRVPTIRTRQACVSQILTWVECRCGARGPEIEDDQRSDDIAVGDWNAGKGRKW